VKGRKGPISLKDVSDALKKLAPSVIDLTNEGNVDDKLIEKNVSELDEKSKTQCLLLFFKFMKSYQEQVNRIHEKRKKNWPSNPYVDDEAGCDDMGDDESEVAADDLNDSFISHESIEEDYLPEHRLVGDMYRGEGHLAPTEGYDTPSGCSSRHDGITGRRSKSHVGKTPEEERDAEGEGNLTTVGALCSSKCKHLNTKQFWLNLFPTDSDSEDESEEIEEEEKEVSLEKGHLSHQGKQYPRPPHQGKQYPRPPLQGKLLHHPSLVSNGKNIRPGQEPPSSSTDDDFDKDSDEVPPKPRIRLRKLKSVEQKDEHEDEDVEEKEEEDEEEDVEEKEEEEEDEDVEEKEEEDEEEDVEEEVEDEEEQGEEKVEEEAKRRTGSKFLLPDQINLCNNVGGESSSTTSPLHSPSPDIGVGLSPRQSARNRSGQTNKTQPGRRKFERKSKKK
jgi:hypothetical protein